MAAPRASNAMQPTTLSARAGLTVTEAERQVPQG